MGHQKSCLGLLPFALSHLPPVPEHLPFLSTKKKWHPSSSTLNEVLVPCSPRDLDLGVQGHPPSMQAVRGDWNRNECGWISGRREGRAGRTGGEGRGLAHGSCASEHSALCGSDLSSMGVQCGSPRAKLQDSRASLLKTTCIPFFSLSASRWQSPSL